MKSLKIFFIALFFLWFGISGASGAPILYESALNIDGAISGTSLGVTGLGTVQVTINTFGAHNVDLFVDHEVDQFTNTWFNETGSANGAVAAGQSWEIDEPGWYNGDIFENFQDSLLDNGIGTSIYGDTVFPEDVSMTMGWDFSLAAGETALLSFVISDDIADMLGGIVLTQTDADSNASIFFSSAIDITGGGPAPVPEPATLLLLGTGLVGIAGFGRKKFKKQS